MEAKKVWDKEGIVELIDRSDEMVRKSLLVVYSLQTDSEKAAQITQDYNKVGFTAFDAEFLSSCAEQLKVKGFLSGKQIAAVRKTIKKYWRQLVLAANGELEYSLA